MVERKKKTQEELEREQRVAEGQKFIQEREKRVSAAAAGDAPTKRLREAVTRQIGAEEAAEGETRTVAEAQAAAEAIRQFQEQVAPTTRELEARIPGEGGVAPGLAPEPLTATGARVGLALGESPIPVPVPEDLVRKALGVGKLDPNSTIGKAVGLTRLGAATGAIGVGSALLTPILASGVTAAIGAKVGSATGAVGKLLTAGALFLGASQLTDIKGDEIDSLKDQISGYAEISSEVVADVEAGMSPNKAIQLIAEMSQSVNEAEARIKQIGIYNLNFRTGKEYLDIQTEALDTRTSLLSAIREIENLVATGEKEVNVQELYLQSLKS